MSFPRYERYKDSGVEWLGEVPEHWRVVPVRSVVRHLDKRNEGAECQDYLSLMANIGVIPYEEKGDIGNKKPEDLSKCKIVRAGNIVINSMNYSIGSYGMSDYDGVCSPVYVVLEINEEAILSRFAFRIFQNTAFQRHAASFGNGILAHRAAIGWGELKVIGIAVPSEEEQQSILSFLDDELERIDGLIEEQRRLIELLKEKRQAVISHAVTKGLDPDAPMKDSGTFWIGKVPRHWDVSSLRHFARFSSGSTPDRTKESYWGGDIPWVKTGEIDYAVINDTEEMISVEGMAESSVTLVPAGSMLLALYGQGVTRGRVAMLGVDATFNQACVAIESDERLDMAYLYAFFVFAYRFIREIGNETTQMNLNLDFVKAIRVLLPPLQEQRSIAEVVASHMSNSDALVEEAEKAIYLLQERRSALISAAVTGKIDVRNYVPSDAAQLEEAYEPA